VEQESIDTKLALLQQGVGFIKEEVKSINNKLEKDHITRDQFEPVRNLVYGLVGLMLTAVIVGLMAVIIK